MPQYSKSDIQQRIAQDETKQAIDILLELTEPLENSKWHDELLLQASKLQDLNRRKRKRTLYFDQIQVTKARINDAILALLHELPKDTFKREIEYKTSKNPFQWKSILLIVIPIIGILLLILWNKQNSNASSTEIKTEQKPQESIITQKSNTTNSIFPLQDEENFNVLIIRFEDYITEANTYCLGRAIEEHLSVIAANEELTLPLHTVYVADTINPPSNREEAMHIQARHHSDLIIYGLARNVEENCAGAEVCFRYGIAEHLKQNTNADIEVETAKHDAEYIKTSPMEIEAGQLKINALSMKYWISSLINFKAKEEEQAYADLTSLVSIDTFGLSDKEKLRRYFEVAKTYYDLKLFDKAIENYSRAVALAPNYASAYHNRGVVYSYLKQYERAISNYDKSLELAPNDAMAYYNRGIAYSGLQQYERAISDYNKTLELTPNNVIVYNSRGNAYYYLKQYDRAISNYDKILELDSSNSDAYYSRGGAYYYLEQYDKSINDYNKALELNPSYESTYSNRGTVYFDLKQYKRAINDFDKAIELNPDNAKYYDNRGLSYTYLKQYDKAFSDYNKAIELNPNFVNSYNNLGFVYNNLKQYAKSISSYNKAIELDPNHAFAYSSLAYSQLKINQLLKAKINLEKSQSLDASNSWLYRNWACYYMLKKQEIKAIENLEKAIQLGYDDKTWLEEEEILDPIRKHPRFIKLMNAL